MYSHVKDPRFNSRTSTIDILSLLCRSITKRLQTLLGISRETIKKEFQTLILISMAKIHLHLCHLHLFTYHKIHQWLKILLSINEYLRPDSNRHSKQIS